MLLFNEMEAQKRKVDEQVMDDGRVKNIKKKMLDPGCGTLVFCGTTDFVNVLKPAKLAEQSFQSKLNMNEPVKLAALQGVRIRHVGSGPEAGHLVVVDESGQVKQAIFLLSQFLFLVIRFGLGETMTLVNWASAIRGVVGCQVRSRLAKLEKPL